ncbi:DNA recombination protein RmuC [Magnetovibrio sp. PR-2]|uniref:DNA recombination protein RmuC n=1 Tax=Magnetovibrio sp. PR-2 TaxID=3120356 RepID=UPI002FCDF337
MDSQIVIDTNLLIAVGCLVVALGVVWAMVSSKRNSQHADLFDRIVLHQAELTGRLQAMGETQTGLSRTLEDRLDSVNKRLGDGLTEHSQRTGDVIKQVHERLAVIDAAQKNLNELSDQMVGLQDILSNKQTRGAFGEIQLNDLVTDVLPPSAYEFQATLSNKKRADCLLKLPNPPGPIVIDSKFPLESFLALKNAETDEDRKRALSAFGTDILKHVKDIADKYIVPGETAESALMFLPSEAVYAELHASLPDVVEKSYRARVWIVSPTTMMATLNTVRAVLKDAQMREQAGLIQNEVRKLMRNVELMDERVLKLRKNFDTANKTIGDIETSSTRIKGDIDRVDRIQLGEETSAEELQPPTPAKQTAANRNTAKPEIEDRDDSIENFISESDLFTT